ncbi:hypothetical protein D910_01903 [Dendroctonus ponderosae]|uniref:Reverse transcriptase domain-containing protein n=1 Tax=Dendroctonus ponderosae TaxID=77166 RepID=U4TUM7_DENPD|nr:hypothetical protein D910_01903 [Dendroctonus ponderosae]
MWKVKIHPGKSQALLIGRRRDSGDGNINIDGVDVEWKQEAKYLGIILDKQLTWRKQVQTSINKAKAVTSKLYPLLNRQSHMSIRNKLLLIKTIIRPALTYGSTSWGYASECHLKRLQATENKIRRMAVDAPWFVREI